MVMLDVWFLVSSGFATFISGIVVGVALVRSLRSYDGKTIVVIGHGATRFGIEYWCGDASLEEIVRGPWEWREVPICEQGCGLYRSRHFGMQQR